MKNQVAKTVKNSLTHDRAQASVGAGCVKLASTLKPVVRVSYLSRVLSLLKNFFKQDDLTFEQWERLERKYSPHSSHHAQIYYRDRR
jgi:hypothetical protein